MFCPECKSEYRDGLTLCADCGVPLVEQLDEAEVEQAPSAMESSEDGRADEVILIANDMAEAEAVKGLLEASGVEVFLSDEASPFPGATGGLRLIVNKTQEHLAQDILKTHRNAALPPAESA